uniref:one cut domain family member 3-like n=1 Tax=Arvicanthis niloticus TaxID=61156 RepID=UPI0014869E37|nr:one cut domain family member 3-like [Arvicanthis niloticus]
MGKPHSSPMSSGHLDVDPPFARWARGGDPGTPEPGAPPPVSGAAQLPAPPQPHLAEAEVSGRAAGLRQWLRGGGGGVERRARRQGQAGGGSGRSPGWLAAYSGRLGAAAGAHGSVRGGRRGAGAAGPHGQRRHSGRPPLGPPIRGRHPPIMLPRRPPGPKAAGPSR